MAELLDALEAEYLEIVFDDCSLDGLHCQWCIDVGRAQRLVAPLFETWLAAIKAKHICIQDREY